MLLPEGGALVTLHTNTRLFLVTSCSDDEGNLSLLSFIFLLFFHEISDQTRMKVDES